MLLPYRNLLFAGILLILPVLLQAQITQTLPLHNGLGQDTYIWRTQDCSSSANTTNNSNVLYIWAWTWNSIGNCGEGETIALVQVDLQNAVKNKTLEKAELRLYFPKGSPETHTTGNTGLNIYRNTSPWHEDTATWNTGTPTYDVNSRISVAAATSSTQNFSIDITTIAKSWFCGGLPNYGVRIQLQSNQIYRRLSFASSEHNDTTLHPRLVLTFKADSAFKLKASTDSVCAGGAVKLEAPDTTGTYSWTSIPAGFTSSIPKPTANPSDPTTYVLQQIIDGCPRRDSITIHMKNPGKFNITSTRDTICQGDTAQLTAAGGCPGTFTWRSIPAGFSSNVSNPVIIPQQTTTYIAERKVGSFTDEDTITIQVIQAPVINITTPKDSICDGETIQISDVGGGTATYSWTSVPAGFTSTVSNPSISPQQNTWYILEKKETTCGSRDSVRIVIANPGVLNAAISADTVCKNIEVQLTATGPAGSGYAYNWSSVPTGFNSNLASAKHSPAASTQYILTAQKAGCFKYDTVDVFVYPDTVQLVATASPDTMCNGGQVSLTVTMNGKENAQFLWKSATAGFTSTTPDTTFTLTQTRKFILIATDQNNCQHTDTQDVLVFNPPVPQSGDLKACFESPNDIVLSENAHSVIWLPQGIESQQIIISEPGTYKVLLANAFGCTSEKEFIIKDTCRGAVHIPTAFRPHSDIGANTVFGPVFSTEAKYTLEVYNRWGQSVYTGQGPWNGQLNNNGPECLPGGYVYFLKVQFLNGEKRNLIGTVFKLN